MNTRQTLLCFALLLSVSLLPQVRAAQPPAAKKVTVESFGAAGDGKTDDTQAVQHALDALHAGDTLVFAAGKTYPHSDVLVLKVSGVRLTGGGTLLATREARSDFHIDADNVTVEGGLTFRMAATTRRWDAYEQMKLRLSHHTGIMLRHITIDGSAAAGIYIGNGCNHYRLEDVTVQNTRADGIHNTGGAHDGVIRRPVIRNVGDDGVAVVSYGNDGSSGLCHDITVESPRFYGNVWGRAFSVVGGEDITYRNIYAESSNAAALYIATEGNPYFTFASRRIRVLGGELKYSNQNAKVDHGAVLVYSGRPGYANTDIVIADLKITDTRANAGRQVGILGEASHVELRHLTISGGPSHLFYTNAPAEAYNTLDWTYTDPTSGVTHPADHVGFKSDPPAKR